MNISTAVLAAALLFSTALEGQDSTRFAEMELGFDVYRVAELELTPIDLGTVLINGDGGVVAMDADGGVAFSGGVLTVADGPLGSPQPGTLTLDAAAGVTANIVLPQAVNLGGGVVFTPSLESSSVTMTGSPVTVHLYGTLLIPPNTQSGSYGGILAVDVSYN